MRTLVIREHPGYFTVENSEGQRSQGRTLDGAVAAFGNKYGIDWAGGDIHSGYDASSALDTMMGKVISQGQIHEGVVSG